MDAIDGRILRALQRDARRPVAELAAQVGLSPSACHRRVKLLEEAGVIAGYAARLDRARLGLSIDVFVEIALASQSEESLSAFEAAVLRFDDILECVLTTGEADYLLRVAARDVADFERIHRSCLARLPGVSSMRTSFALRSVKDWRGLPVAF
jgi:DNA-binding Lrp family transcriptional regulator